MDQRLRIRAAGLTDQRRYTAGLAYQNRPVLNPLPPVAYITPVTGLIANPPLDKLILSPTAPTVVTAPVND
jgi:hypothetical protein